MYKENDAYPSCSVIERAYTMTIATSPLRKFLIVMVMEMFMKLGLTDKPTLRGEFLADLAEKLSALSEKGKELWIAETRALRLSVDHASGLETVSRDDVQNDDSQSESEGESARVLPDVQTAGSDSFLALLDLFTLYSFALEL
jgi:hypothetical protein